MTDHVKTSRRPPSKTKTESATAKDSALAWVGTLGLPLAFVLAVVGFGLAQPETFLSAANLKQITSSAATPAILAAGLTLPLVMGSFDLSVGSMVGVGGASAVALMSLHGAPWYVSVLVAFAIAVAVGLINGFVIVRLRVSAFITTLAMATILLGVEYLFTNQVTLYSGISPTYLKFGQAHPFAGISVQVWIALVVAIVLLTVLELTEVGRHMYAIGSNRQAAYLAGLRIPVLETSGFVIAAICAAIVGILITAQAGASTPNAGAPYLLPAYAAAFLGTAAFRRGRFNIAGSVLGALFLATISSGLTILNISTALIDIVQGGILILAVLLTGFGGRGGATRSSWERGV